MNKIKKLPFKSNLSKKTVFHGSFISLFTYQFVMNKLKSNYLSQSLFKKEVIHRKSTPNSQ